MSFEWISSVEGILSGSSIAFITSRRLSPLISTRFAHTWILWVAVWPFGEIVGPILLGEGKRIHEDAAWCK